MQIVYISNRPEILRGTLSSVLRYMPFVKAAVLVVPRNAQQNFSYASDLLPVEFIHDESLVNAVHTRLDHQARDYLLRTSLSEQSSISEEFIMSDDDYRPIAPVDLSFFKSDGKYRSYYFYDLCDWVFDDTEFDRGQHNTCQLLRYLGYPHLSYASHMPQIICKDLLRAARDRFAPYSGELSLCEWATYFNHAHRHHPELFLPPEPYKTLCWPACVTCWPRAIEPDEYVFENFSPDLYARNRPFHHIDPEHPDDRDIRFDKVLAWHRHELSVLHGRSVDTDTALRRIFYRLLRPLRRLEDVLWLRERSQLMQLNNRLKRIENQVDGPY